MMLCYSETRKIKYFLDPPKRLKDIMNGLEMSTRTSVCLYQQPVTWIFTRSGLSRLSDSDYKVIPSLKIIIKLYTFFQAYISAFMIYCIHEKTKLQLTLNL